ncbi:MAG: chlorophyll synthesis pathway protein BchC [Pseudomonadota bacterium]
MQVKAVIFEEPQKLILEETHMSGASEKAVVVETVWSGISAGTERLLWEGRMPNFPGMGYPLVPGYETVGKIVDAPASLQQRIDELVFVPGCSAYDEVRGLFGGAASHLLVENEKAFAVPEGSGEDAVLLALAATAHHALTHNGTRLPSLIVGNGILGRLAARLCVSLGGNAPVIWEKEKQRADSPDGFQVIEPQNDEGKPYDCIMDLSGDASLLNHLIKSLAPSGEIILAGFYSVPITFDFSPAFMKEARLRISAEWKPNDLIVVRNLVNSGRLSLGGLISHRQTATLATEAYQSAFEDPECLKMVLNWKEAA